jgi:hypothetical protein
VDFVEYYVSAVIGLRHFEKHKCTQLYREYVTISDEAFAILTIENNWSRWIDMATTEDWRSSSVPTKWTVTRDKTATAERRGRGNSKNDDDVQPTARRYRGWSAIGIERYNQLFDEITSHRAKNSSTLLEDRLLKHFQHETDMRGKSKRKQKKEPPPLPMARHQLWVRDSITVNGGPPLNTNSQDTHDEDDEEIDELPKYS